MLCASLAVSACVVACSTGESFAETAGSCEAPSISVTAPEVQVGDTVEISGKAFFDGCADAIVVDESGMEHKDEVHPLSHIPVALEQNGSSYALGTISADDNGTWSVEFPLPSNVIAGIASISAGTAEPAEITVDPAN